MSTHLIPMLLHNSNDFDTVFAVIKLFVRVTMPPVGVSSAYRQASSHRPERWSNLVPASVIADDMEDATKRDLSACLHEYALLSGPVSGGLLHHPGVMAMVQLPFIAALCTAFVAHSCPTTGTRCNFWLRKRSLPLFWHTCRRQWSGISVSYARRAITAPDFRSGAEAQPAQRSGGMTRRGACGRRKG